ELFDGVNVCIDEVGRLLAERGHEVGATTGRPRRCGWLDLAALRRASLESSMTSLCLTKLDVLDPVPVIKLCIAYRLDGKEILVPPLDIEELKRCEPIYEE